MNSNACYGQGGHMDAPVIPSLRRPQLGSTAMTDETDEGFGNGIHMHAPAISEADARSISQRLFGKVVVLGSQVCQGPCVGDEKLAFAFAPLG